MAKAKQAGADQPPAQAHRTLGAMGAGGMADRVWFSCGLTLNLGNYESARVDAGMATDVRPGEELDDALLRCKDFVTHEIEGQQIDVRRSLREKTGEPQPGGSTFKAPSSPKKSAKKKY